MSLMIIKHSIPEDVRGTKPEEITQAKCFLDEIEKRFAKNDKVDMTSLLTSLMSMKCKGQENVREYIMEMFHVASRLKELMIYFSEELLGLMVLDVTFGGENKVRDIIFEEELDSNLVSAITFDDVQVLIPIIDQ
ncbi:hypothetical protein J1N35_010806 [Gossypium stocksii]|uniref:Uncharacterized protein n=1 Tax=Gossypium stocksii TaxID=47602 RepID=A0A9D4ACP6_9ROSI|nr:hypothetical protein J1N35_010806 [Gossypium stocksii]